MSSYTDTRKNYYETNKDEIKRKRREKYQLNKKQEIESAKKRHMKNKTKNNKKDLDNYYEHADELNEKRTVTRGYKHKEKEISFTKKKYQFTTI